MTTVLLADDHALIRRGLRTVLLVTDAIHMRRARALFERAGFTVRPAPTDDGDDTEDPRIE